MKLRIRSFETNETLKIDIPLSPTTCTLQQLKHHISQSLPSSSSSNPVHVSLNRKEELQDQSSEDVTTLQSLGITSGDLIYFTFNPNAFSISPQTLTPNSHPTQDPNFLNNSDTQLIQEPESVKKFDTQMIQEPETAKKSNTQIIQEPETVKKWDTQMTQEPETVKKWNTQMIQESETVKNFEEIEEFMEVDDDDVAVDVVDFRKSFSVPGFLRKVFTEELSGDDGGGGDHKLLVVALHAVFVESGFVLVEPVSFSESQILKYWPSHASRKTLFYTLPEVIHNMRSGSFTVNRTVELKFQFLGKFFIAHGSISGGGNSMHRVKLNEDQLVPLLNVVWANCGLHEELITGEDGGFGTVPEREVFQFWKNVKDGLVLPLLIDLCEKAGLQLPPCFTRLPTDLKLKVLELLPGVDIAKVSCVSSELRYLGSSDDLWKKKYVEQFCDTGTSGEGGHWKDKFVKSWQSRKRRKTFRTRVPLPFIPLEPWRPHIIGGDYDLFPPPFDNTGNPLGRALSSRFFRPLPNHVPRCNLGGHRSSFT